MKLIYVKILLSRTYKTWLPVILASIGIFAGIFYILSTSTPPPVSKPLVTPQTIPFKYYISGSGITEPNTENISIGTNVAGIVSEIYVHEGQQIKKGDLLFTIEDRKAKAEVDKALAELNNAQDQYNIVFGIKDSKAVSKDELNIKMHAVESAKANYEALKTALELYTVKSPIDGTVMNLNIKKGEQATTAVSNLDDSVDATNSLMLIGNMNPLHLRIDIDENDAWRFKKNAKAIAYLRGNPKINSPIEYVYTEPYIKPKKSLTGASTERVDTRVLNVIYKLDPKDLPIYSGQQMDVYIEADPVDYGTQEEIK